MSNWLGFSLNPDLSVGDDDKIGGSAGDEEAGVAADNHGGGDGCFLPLRSDGSFSVLDSKHYWRYDNDVNGPNAGEEAPKFEDFLGCCYSNSPSNDAGAEINVNISPSFSDDQKRDGFANPSPFFHPYHYSIVHTGANPDGVFSAALGGGGSGGGGAWLQEAEKVEGSGGRCDLQALSLTVSSSSQTAALPPPPPDGKKRTEGKCSDVKEPTLRKSIDTFGQRTSQYRGVTRHRWTGRYEAHLWDNSCRKEGQTRKGRQVYLGGYDIEDKAARAYDLAALKYWGPTTHINFPLSTYEKDLEEMKNMSRQEFVAHLRRRSSGFSRGASMYRGVTRHHQHGRWQARIGRVAGNKDLYLGTFSTQEEAAEAYDIAAIRFRGTSAVTNFDITRYDVKRICSSSTLIAGDLAKRSPKHSELGHEDYNTCNSSHHRAFIPMEEPNCNELLTEMMWKADGDEAASGRSSRSPSPKGEGQGGGYYEASDRTSSDVDFRSHHTPPMFALWND